MSTRSLLTCCQNIYIPWRITCILIVSTFFILPVIAHAQSWVNVGNPGFSTGEVSQTSIAIDPSGAPYVFCTNGSLDPGAVMKYNGGSWVAVGAVISSWANQVSIAIDASGTPYVATTFGPTADLGVGKYNGSSWEFLDTAEASISAAFPSVAIDTGGTPYVVYSDASNGKKATVIKCNNTGCFTVGSPGFTTAEADWTSIAIDRSGTPYVVFVNGSGSGWDLGPVSVMKYVGGSWGAVGSPHFSAGSAYYTSIAIDTGGTPYVAYTDSVNGYKATVMKYSGGNWVAVGTAGFSEGGVSSTSIAINSNGIPYVAYVDSAHGNRATVMKYNGTSWVNVGSPDFSAGPVDVTAIAISSSGIPYVVYHDFSTPNSGATVMRYGWPEQVTNVSSGVSAITTFPDPSHGSFTLNLSATTSEDAQITITNIIGEKVKELNTTTNSDTQIRLDAPPGIYIISAVTTEGELTSKIVVW